MRSEGYGSWVCLCVCVCVCVSVTQHLTYRMFIRPTNDTTYLTGNDGQKIVGFSLKISVAELERFQYSMAIASRPFYSGENAHAYFILTTAILFPFP